MLPDTKNGHFWRFDGKALLPQLQQEHPSGGLGRCENWGEGDKTTQIMDRAKTRQTYIKLECFIGNLITKLNDMGVRGNANRLLIRQIFFPNSKI